IVAWNVGSNGTATINGAGSRWEIAGQLFVGGDGAANGGTGQVNVTAGGVLSVGSRTRIRTPGAITVSNATFDAGNIVTVNGERALAAGGVLNGNLNVSGGTISGTGGVNGQLTVPAGGTGALLAAGGTLNIGDDTHSNTIHNSGTLNIGGTVVLHD